MKIWYDATTGKHVRYGTAIGKRLKKEGHEFFFTTREHPDTLPLATALGEKICVVGKYNPSSLFSRLEESAQRILEFTQLFKGNKPDVAIAHQSVELCRVAFGLNIPIILTADTPHAKAVNRLTIPYGHTVLVSESLPRSFTSRYCAQKVIPFKGIDEVAWVKDFEPKKSVKSKTPLILLREIENKAVYVKEKHDNNITLADQLAKLGDVRFINRYNIQGETFGSKPTFEDTLSIVASADLVVSYGGTISREAALLGIPSIAISDMAKTYVNKYLAKKGFPLFITTPKNVLTLGKRYLGKHFDVRSKLEELENPVDIIIKIIENLKVD